jgi:hypothetical protein
MNITQSTQIKAFFFLLLMMTLAIIAILALNRADKMSSISDLDRSKLPQAIVLQPNIPENAKLITIPSRDLIGFHTARFFVLKPEQRDFAVVELNPNHGDLLVYYRDPEKCCIVYQGIVAKFKVDMRDVKWIETATVGNRTIISFRDGEPYLMIEFE